MLKKMSPTQAAMLMGKSVQFIRLSLINNTLPIGNATFMGKRWSYYISPEKFKEYTGIDPEKALEEAEITA